MRMYCVFATATASSTRRQLTVSLFWRWGMSSASNRIWKLIDSWLTIVWAMRAQGCTSYVRAYVFLSSYFALRATRASRVAPRVFIAKRVKREKYRGLGNERISRVAKKESAKVIVMENKKKKKNIHTTSRRAKCFDVLCVCANENIFQKGDTSPLAETIFY